MSLVFMIVASTLAGCLANPSSTRCQQLVDDADGDGASKAIELPIECAQIRDDLPNLLTVANSICQPTNSTTINKWAHPIPAMIADNFTLATRFSKLLGQQITSNETRLDARHWNTTDGKINILSQGAGWGRAVQYIGKYDVQASSTEMTRLQRGMGMLQPSEPDLPIGERHNHYVVRTTFRGLDILGEQSEMYPQTGNPGLTLINLGRSWQMVEHADLMPWGLAAPIAHVFDACAAPILGFASATGRTEARSAIFDGTIVYDVWIEHDNPSCPTAGNQILIDAVTGYVLGYRKGGCPEQAFKQPLLPNGGRATSFLASATVDFPSRGLLYGFLGFAATSITITLSLLAMARRHK